MGADDTGRDCWDRFGVTNDTIHHCEFGRVPLDKCRSGHPWDTARVSVRPRAGRTCQSGSGVAFCGDATEITHRYPSVSADAFKGDGDLTDNSNTGSGLGDCDLDRATL